MLNYNGVFLTTLKFLIRTLSVCDDDDEEDWIKDWTLDMKWFQFSRITEGQSSVRNSTQQEDKTQDRVLCQKQTKYP